MRRMLRRGAPAAPARSHQSFARSCQSYRQDHEASAVPLHDPAECLRVTRSAETSAGSPGPSGDDDGPLARPDTRCDRTPLRLAAPGHAHPGPDDLPHDQHHAARSRALQPAPAADRAGREVGGARRAVVPCHAGQLPAGDRQHPRHHPDRGDARRPPASRADAEPGSRPARRGAAARGGRTGGHRLTGRAGGRAADRRAARACCGCSTIPTRSTSWRR